MNEKEKIRAILMRNAAYDGQFYYGVKTTKIVCKPSCRARIPNPENIILFDTLQEATTSGFRPCKICLKGEKFDLKESTK